MWNTYFSLTQNTRQNTCQAVWFSNCIPGIAGDHGGEELSLKAKFLIYQSSYVPTLPYGNELGVVTKRMRLGIWAAEISFLCRVAEFSLRDRVGCSDILRELWVEQLLICVKKEPEVVWATIPPGHLPQDPTNWEVNLGKTQNVLDRLCISPQKVVLGKKDVWNTLLKLLPLQSDHS